jgi:NADP-dependent 3-hydroxy acid dehydrogenase YdfG/acyl carrier protein
VLQAVGQLWTVGQDVDWGAVYAGSGARTIDLPTYAFQHQHYWTNTPTNTDLTSVGQRPTEHPLLGAAVDLPGATPGAGAGAVLTGRLSAQSLPWAADHRVSGALVLPGTALLELAFHAGDRVGCAVLEELTLRAPLVLPDDGGIAVQVRLGAEETGGGRSVSVYSRPDTGSRDDSGEWTLNATGTLRTGQEAPDSNGEGDFTSWPPADAEPIDLTEGYELLAENGLQYGPVFQGLRAAWRRGDDVFAEISLPEGARDEAARYALHPALLDAAMHASMIIGVREDANGPGTDGGRGVAIPFIWSDVTLHAVSASALRVRLSRTGEDTIGLHAADTVGNPVLTVASMISRPLSAQGLTGAGRDSLFQLGWVGAPDAAEGREPAADVVVGAGVLVEEAGIRRLRDLQELKESLDSGAVPPVRVFLPVDGPDGDSGTSGDVVRATRDLTRTVLATVQEWLSCEQFAGGQLVVVTRGAVSVDGDGTPVCPASAAVWGLVRSAREENPGRFALVDLDRAVDRVPAVLGAEEPEIAVREGAWYVPRLVRARLEQSRASGFDLSGTVVVTGGTGGLGALVSRYLVAHRGVEHLVLVGRRGPDAPGAAELCAELEELGASVTPAACDVSDRAQVDELLGKISADRPVTAIVHAAGVLDDGVVSSLTAERLDGVLGPKAYAAWHLHEATSSCDRPVSLVFFSSVAGVMGSPGQANYSAGNTFLDRLAEHRHSLGLPGVSVAWGLWEQPSGMGGRLGEADVARMDGSGIAPLSSQEGLELFGTVLDSAPPAFLMAAHLEVEAACGQGTVPPLLRVLHRPAPAQDRRRAAQSTVAPDERSLSERLIDLRPAERRQTLLELVHTTVAIVLGHGSAQAVDPDRGFLELGFDSLAALDLRNRLNAVTGQRLPATLIYDYPSVTAVADFLYEELAGELGAAALDAEFTRLRSAVDRLEPGELRSTRVVERLQELARTLASVSGEEGQVVGSSQPSLDAATADELFDILDSEFGSSD